MEPLDGLPSYGERTWRTHDDSQRVILPSTIFLVTPVTPRVPNSQSLSWYHLIVVQYPPGLIPSSEYKKHPHGQWSQWNVEFPYIHHGFVERGCLI